MNEKKGIDVSYAQGRIDFEIVDPAQVGFAIVRSSFGWMEGQKDEFFDRNIKGFKALGIPCGAYHYSYARSAEDAVKEAEYCLECIGNVSLELPVFLDMEDSTVSQCGRRVCTDIAKTFCDRISRAGRKTGIYLNPDWLEHYVYKDELIGKYTIWLAQWGSKKPSYDCMIWQYDVGGKGCINGISGECDLDIMYVSEKTPSKDDKKKPSAREKFQKGDHVVVLDPVIYGTDRKFTVYPDEDYTVIEASGNRIVIGIDGQVTAAIDAKYLRKAGSADSKKERIYIVQPGDTLWSIAERFHTTVKDIAEANHLADPDLIFGGQKLKI